MMDNDLNSEEQVRKAYRKATGKAEGKAVGVAAHGAVREQAHGTADDAISVEPPTSIDDAIRAAARRAVAAKPQPLQKKWHQRWAAPLAAAATVLLTSSIIFVAMEEHPKVITEPLGDAALATRVEMSAPLTTPMVASLPAPKPEPVLEQAAPISAAASVAAPVAAPVAAQKSASAMVNDVDSRRQKSNTVDTTQVIIAQPKSDSAPRADFANAALEKKAVADASGASTKAEDQTRQRRAESAPAITNVMPTLANKPTKEAPVSVVSGAVSTTDSAAPSTPAFAPPPPLALAAPKAALSAPADAPVNRKLAGIVADKLEKNETAEAWIARMDDLKARLKNDALNRELNNELRAELTRFRKRYPNVVLPESLAEEWAKIERAKTLPP